VIVFLVWVATRSDVCIDDGRLVRLELTDVTHALASAERRAPSSSFLDHTHSPSALMRSPRTAQQLTLLDTQLRRGGPRLLLVGRLLVLLERPNLETETETKGERGTRL
jgi:hypothetical protein